MSPQDCEGQVVKKLYIFRMTDLASDTAVSDLDLHVYEDHMRVARDLDSPYDLGVKDPDRDLYARYASLAALRIGLLPHAGPAAASGSSTTSVELE